MYQISLPQFEGPFDLLLFFIERDELDIHDIPISTITNDFLNYIHTFESLNMEVASEFILVAATLMKIKAKMLLPRPVIKEDGTVEDPRTELVNRLLEYKRYKAVMEDLRLMEETYLQQAPRGYAKKEEKELLKSEFPGDELVGIDLYSLMKTFRRVWNRHKDKMEAPRHVIRSYPYTLDQLKDTVMTRIQGKKKMDFVSLVTEVPEKIYVVFGFLAILELIQQQQLTVTIGNGYNNFWLSPRDQVAA
ncbi:MAG: segregation/condensation protein A [Bacteroidia bacterium]|nr:segregation/condensation protein A [Bacteroidia bacterium]